MKALPGFIAELERLKRTENRETTNRKVISRLFAEKERLENVAACAQLNADFYEKIASDEGRTDRFAKITELEDERDRQANVIERLRGLVEAAIEWRRADVHEAAVTLGERGGDHHEAHLAEISKRRELRISIDRHVKAAKAELEGPDPEAVEESQHTDDFVSGLDDRRQDNA